VTPRVGVDVAAIPRLEEAHRRFGNRFLQKFLSEREIAYCAGSAERWAGRWAAKEAIGKAMPAGVARPWMRQVEILPSEDGRPHVRVDSGTTLTGKEVDVSIAHDGHFAVAVAVIPDLETPSLTLNTRRRETREARRLPDGFRLPDRPRDGHKGTFGTVAVLAGSQGYTGAAYLTSMGAARAGAGIVRLMVAQSIYPILAEKCTEVVVGPVPEIAPGVVGHSALAAVQRGFAGAAAGIIGPGIGRDTSTRRLIEDIIPRLGVPLVIDADGLNLLSEHRTVLAKLPSDIVLTPHPAEFGRLANLETASVQKDRRGIASRFAKTWNKIVVLKGADTVIAAPDGRVTLNPIGTPALASGGTGDVLSGMIGGLMAQKLTPFEAAVTGVHLHSLAGLELESRLGRAGVLASDLLPEIPRIMERFR
jgi:holo-[acyl-carrier-protein] synthase